MAKKEKIGQDRVWKDDNGRIHRFHGPAIEDSDGRKMWYSHGIPHREDGPAVEWADGQIEWWIHGYQYFIPNEMPLSLFLAYVKWMRNYNGRT